MFERGYRDLDHVPRWTIIRTNRYQSVATHSYYVILYSAQIAQCIAWEGPMDSLLLYAINHDLDEIITGDIPSPYKRVMEREINSEDMESLRVWKAQQVRQRFPISFLQSSMSDNVIEEIKLIVSVADILDGVLFLADELFAGNNNVVPTKDYLQRKLFEAVERLPSETTLMLSLRTKLIDAIGGCSTASSLVTE